MKFIQRLSLNFALNISRKVIVSFNYPYTTMTITEVMFIIGREGGKEDAHRVYAGISTV